MFLKVIHETFHLDSGELPVNTCCELRDVYGVFGKLTVVFNLKHTELNGVVIDSAQLGVICKFKTGFFYFSNKSQNYGGEIRMDREWCFPIDLWTTVYAYGPFNNHLQ